MSNAAFMFRLIRVAAVVAVVAGVPSTTQVAQAQSRPESVEKSEAAAENAVAPAAASSAMARFGRVVDAAAGRAAKVIGDVLFFDLSRPFVAFLPGRKPLGLAALVVYLALAALGFTFYTRFLNVRGFRHAIAVTAGRYDDPSHAGEVSHFQALTAALSGTVGLGNIAGVAIAVATGGPGATFWMIVAGFLGMSSKFVECTLGQKYREVRSDGRVMGGAMQYLSKGLRGLGLGPLGSVLAVLFAVLCICGSFGGGNAFQVSQSMNAVKEQVPLLGEQPWLYGLTMAVLVGLVILGGIQRIARVADKIVPFMCVFYCAACLFILAKNWATIPAAFASILEGAFRPEAAYGGFLGVLILGFRRASFSNEAGIGSAAIAHSAARTDHPVREGIVSLLEPFIDTVVICTMTALVIVITGVYAETDPAILHLIESNQGSALTAKGMGREVSWFPWVVSIAAFLFAYATMISWSYYGERCWAYLFGDRSSIVYRMLFLVCTFLGSVVSATNVLDLSDYLLLAMAVPNVIGLVLLAPEVRRDLDDYWRKYQAGDFEPGRSSSPSRPA